MRIAMIACCILLLYRIQSLVYRKLWHNNLNVYLRFEKRQVNEGETILLDEVLENRKWLPLPVVFLQFKLSKFFQIAGEPTVVSEDRYTRNEMMSVLMNQRLRRRVELTCRKRGIYTIERASVVAQSLFLDEKYVQEIICDSTLTVYPRMVDARQFEQFLHCVSTGDLLQPFMQPDPFLHRGVREYQIYDSMKSINWNATARTGEMKVNLLETVSNQHAYVFLNVQKESLAVHNEVIEESIRLAKTFCALFSRKGIKSQLYTNGTAKDNLEPICVSSGVGFEYMTQVNEALTRVFLDENGNILTHGREQELDFLEFFADILADAADNGQVVFISNSQDSGIRNLLRSLHRQGRQFLWIIPVENTSSYREDSELKHHMRIWRLNFEGAKEAAV